jgi:predicted metal-dependent hydrolase
VYDNADTYVVGRRVACRSVEQAMQRPVRGTCKGVANLHAVHAHAEAEAARASNTASRVRSCAEGSVIARRVRNFAEETSVRVRRRRITRMERRAGVCLGESFRFA